MAVSAMSDHSHNAVQFDSPKVFQRKLRNKYSRYFNAKYSRCGRLGDKFYFCDEMDGIKHITAGLNYIMRQGLHHGITATPFGYRYSSVNTLFRKELGKSANTALIINEKRYKYLSGKTQVPLSQPMSEDGLLLLENIIDVSYVESVYVTPRNFLLQMNKITDERVREEQMQELSNTQPITIDVIEKGTADFDARSILANEHGRVDKNLLTDIDLCELIDSFYIPRIVKGKIEMASPYILTREQRIRLANNIWGDMQAARKRINQKQLARCMCLSYE